MEDDYTIIWIDGKAYYLYYETDILKPVDYENC